MRISGDQKLFAELLISLLEQMYKNYNTILSESCDPVRDANKESILNEIAKIMLKYNIKDSNMAISKVQQMKLYNELCTKINEMFSDEFNTEKECISDILESVVKDAYYINSYVTSIGIDYTLKPVSESVLKEIINHKIDDKTWSEFLWDDKVNLRKDLKLQVKKFLNGETNVNKISDIIQDKYENNKYVTDRLVNHNIAIVQEKANDVWRENHNINWVLYMGTLDHKICDKCKQYDGKSYESDDRPIDLPQHIGCRCTYVNIPNKDWRPTQRLDNVTKEKVDWQAYEEWLSKQKQTGGKYTRGDIAWNDRREDEAKEYYELTRARKDDIKKISQNTGFSEKMISKIKEHVFYNDKHILYGGEIGLLAPDYDMSVAWQRLINGNFEERDILLLRHEYLESGIEKRYNLTNKQAHDITTKKYDWWGKLESEKGELGEDDCLTEIIREE